MVNIRKLTNKNFKSRLKTTTYRTFRKFLQIFGKLVRIWTGKPQTFFYSVSVMRISLKKRTEEERSTIDTTPVRVEWFIEDHRGPGFLAVLWFGSSPTLPTQLWICRLEKSHFWKYFMYTIFLLRQYCIWNRNSNKRCISHKIFKRMRFNSKHCPQYEIPYSFRVAQL